MISITFIYSIQYKILGWDSASRELGQLKLLQITIFMFLYYVVIYKLGKKYKSTYRFNYMFHDIQDRSTPVQFHDDPQLLFYYKGGIVLSYILVVKPWHHLMLRDFSLFEDINI